MKNCLIITDIQNDFCPGGALAVAGGNEIIPIVNSLTQKFDKVAATQDWHPSDHVSFAATHDKELYDVITIDGIQQVMWPVHCVQGSLGADFHKDLDLRPVDLIIRKGSHRNIDSYSTFMENDKKTFTGLHSYLQGFSIRDLYFCGLTTDYCVYYSAVDARNMGFNVSVILDACRGVDVPAGNIAATVQAMKERGIRILNHDDLP
ncbi:MAG: bifunctional nicotinamidase/pyrazinamidase [Smithellaceae bacterium]